jgi:hypothetical protein
MTGQGQALLTHDPIDFFVIYRFLPFLLVLSAQNCSHSRIAIRRTFFAYVPNLLKEDLLSKPRRL